MCGEGVEALDGALVVVVVVGEEGSVDWRYTALQYLFVRIG